MILRHGKVACSHVAIACVLMLFGDPAGAQTTERYRDAQAALDRSTVVSLLRSKNSREQAWGAWAAGEGRLRETVPLLQQVVKARLPGADWLTDGVPLDVALDALIQLEAQVPRALLAQVYEVRPAPALILLSRAGPEADAFLLGLLGRERGTAWFTVANLLLRHKTAGMAALLLTDLEIEASVYVSDQGNVGGGSGSNMSAVGDGGGGIAPGYPPLAYYYLTNAAQPGNVVVAGGPEPIYYRRNVAPAGSAPAVNTHEMGGPRVEDRLGYLAALGGFEQRMPIAAREGRSVAWRGQDALNVELEAFRQDISRRYSELVRKLLDADLITDEEASALRPPKIHLQIRDLRSPGRAATPEPEPDPGPNPQVPGEP